MIEMYKQRGFKSGKGVMFMENTITKEILFACYECSDIVLTKEQIEKELF